MELQAVIATELRLQLLDKTAVAVQPRHFVLVLVGQQLEVVPRHGLAQRLVSALVGLLHPRHLLAITLGVGGVLVGGQTADSGRQ